MGKWVRAVGGCVQKRGRVQHPDDARNDLQALRRHLQPGIEGGDELGSYVFARVAEHVIVWAQ